MILALCILSMVAMHVTAKLNRRAVPVIAFEKSLKNKLYNH
jgi:hypothetical protein